MIVRLVIVVAGVALGTCGWIFWFIAYRDADRRAREVGELLESLAIAIQARDVNRAADISRAILRRAGLRVVPKKGPPPEVA